ncbi:MAG: hypothetical protein Q9216_007027 [Gyalolechia sp. 2 TL-2023]
MADADQTYLRKLYPQGHVFVGSLKVGALSGASGLLVGGVAGIIRSPTPGLFAIASGLQWALLGVTYNASREAIFRAWDIAPSAPPQERILPSTLAGGITGGTAGGIIRGRANIIPGIIMFSLFGFAGQHIYNAIDSRQSFNVPSPPTVNSEGAATDNTTANEPRWKRVLNSKYSPMKVLSDEQYEKLLKEKLVKVDAEIALVNEEIEKVKGKVKEGRDSDPDPDPDPDL